MQNKQKKLYTSTATLGWVIDVKSHLVKVQPINGSAPIWCINNHLNKEGYTGKEEVAFDFFVEDGFIVSKAFPLDRAEKLVEWCPHYSRTEKLTALKHPEFKGTLAEFRKFYKGLDKAKTEIPTQEETPVEAEVKAEEPTKDAPVVELPKQKMDIYTKEELEALDKEEETLPEEEVPDDAAEWDEEEAEEYEEESSEYDEYDDDSYYDFDDKPSSKGEWR